MGQPEQREGRQRVMQVRVPTTRTSGSAFPKDFPQHLELFREEAGMSWRELAKRVGVRYGRLMCWRRGTVPKGGALHSLFRVASTMPGGLETLVTGAAWPQHPEDSDEL